MSSAWPEPCSTEPLIAELARTGNAELRDTIIERHRPLVESLARKFTRPGVATEDLVQTAWIALIRALDRYDPGHAASFSTYAIHCMVGEIKRYFRDRTWSMKVPRLLQEIGTSLPRTHDALVERLGREPTVGEMAAALDIDEETLARAMELQQHYRLASLDERSKASAGGEGQSIAETAGYEDQQIASFVRSAPLRLALDKMDARDQLIVRRRFFDGCTQTEVGEELGLSQMHISRLERHVLVRLRASLTAAELLAA